MTYKEFERDLDYTPWGKFPDMSTTEEARQFFNHPDIVKGLDMIYAHSGGDAKKRNKELCTSHLLVYLFMVLRHEASGKKVKSFVFEWKYGEGTVNEGFGVIK